MTEQAPAALTLLQGLQRAALAGPQPPVRELTYQERIIGQGAAHGWLMEDWMIDACLPVELWARWESLCPLAGIAPETLYWRHRARKSRTSGVPGLSLAGIATLAVHIERWGFVLDPAPLVAAARAGFPLKTLLSQHELDLLWWPRVRGGVRALTRLNASLPADVCGIIDGLPSGYRVCAHTGG